MIWNYQFPSPSRYSETLESRSEEFSAPLTIDNEKKKKENNNNQFPVRRGKSKNKNRTGIRKHIGFGIFGSSIRIYSRCFFASYRFSPVPKKNEIKMAPLTSAIFVFFIYSSLPLWIHSGVLYAVENVRKQKLFHKKMERQMFSTHVYSSGSEIEFCSWWSRNKSNSEECVWRGKITFHLSFPPTLENLRLECWREKKGTINSSQDRKPIQLYIHTLHFAY